MNTNTLRCALVGLSATSMLACGAAAVPAAAPSTIVTGQADAGKTIQAKVGDTVQVKLEESFPMAGASLVWDVTTNAPSVLKPGQVVRDPAERPRIGTVSYTAEFNAQAPGQANLIARGSRTCEALNKPGCPNTDFTIKVEVS
jgi:predicted secreted protein